MNDLFNRTQQRRDQHSTEFGLWIRGGLKRKIDPEPILWHPENIQTTDVSQIRSATEAGYVTTNVDYVWENYHNKRWIWIEEKRHCRGMDWSQWKQFVKIDRLSKVDPNYFGFWIIQFENTSPEDGEIYIYSLGESFIKNMTGDPVVFTPDKLVRFLAMDWCEGLVEARIKEAYEDLKFKTKMLESFNKKLLNIEP